MSTSRWPATLLSPRPRFTAFHTPVVAPAFLSPNGTAGALRELGCRLPKSVRDLKRWGLLFFLIFVELLASSTLVIGLAVRMVHGDVIDGLVKYPLLPIAKTLFILLAVLL